jgi:F-type H+-transporting ATP synthase subunit e
VQAEHEKHQIEYAIHKRERLIAEAKEAWKRKQDNTTG